MKSLTAVVLALALLAPSFATAGGKHSTSPKRQLSDITFGVAALGTIADNVGDVPAPKYGRHARHDDNNDSDLFLTARTWAAFPVLEKSHLFANYDWDTRSDFGDGTLRLGGTYDSYSGPDGKLGLYAGTQRSVAGDGDWTVFVGGSAERDLISQLSILGQAEYDFGREVVAGRAGLSLRLF